MTTKALPLPPVQRAAYRARATVEYLRQLASDHLEYSQSRALWSIVRLVHGRRERRRVHMGL